MRPVHVKDPVEEEVGQTCGKSCRVIGDVPATESADEGRGGNATVNVRG
jgi:hypothetical protein